MSNADADDLAALSSAALAFNDRTATTPSLPSARKVIEAATFDAAEARELCETTTPAPWTHVAVRHMQHEVFTPEDDKEEGCARISCWHSVDAEFIAAARSLLPAALSEIERLRGLLAEACDLADMFCGGGNPTRRDINRPAGIRKEILSPPPQRQEGERE